MVDNDDEKLEYTVEEFAELVYGFYGARFDDISQQNDLEDNE